MAEKPERAAWTVPGHLAPYTEYTNYRDRAEELYNSSATAFNNTPKFVMHVETVAQWDLLARLHAAGLLKDTP